MGQRKCADGESLAAPHEVDLQWTAAADDSAGIGVGGYRVYRHGGVYLGTATGTQFIDESAQTGANVAYDIVAFDQYDNAGAAVTTATIAVPAAVTDPRRGRVKPTGA
ncbi:MAG: hypothetical protein JST11_15585 [Acidobacteria bacterium]|nr:hypothetical protein [Acidobacteriota bacterium]